MPTIQQEPKVAAAPVLTPEALAALAQEKVEEARAQLAGMLQGEGPRTLDELKALQFRESRLSTEIQSLTERRARLLQQVLLAPGPEKGDIQRRMREVDDRITSLERELDETNARIANTQPHLLTSASTEQRIERYAERAAEKIVPLAGIVSLLVLAPIALAFARLMWRRTSARPQPAAVDPAVHQRLEQLQQSVDTIAVEVERISESQRFLSKMMNDRQLGAGAAEPVRFAEKAAVANERE